MNRRMRIGIDIRKYEDYGIGTYIQNLINVYQGISDLQCVLYASPKDADRLKPISNVEIQYDSSDKYSLRELFSLAHKANNSTLDLYHAPHYTLPVGLSMPSVVTVHDIIHLRLKEYFSIVQRAYAYAMIRHACTAASIIIVDSEFGKKELLDAFPINEEKIQVVYLGVNDAFFQKIPDEVNKNVLKIHKIVKPYILYTGSLKPHKNVPVLIEAFARVKKEHELQLVFSGERVSENGNLMQLIGKYGLEKSIVDVGRVAQKELISLYQSAQSVVLPSTYEGFGFSVLEAMAAGVPAIGSRSASIPEVVGDAGLLFDSANAVELSEHIVSVLTNAKLRESLIEKGLNRARTFSWKKCSEKTVEVYRKVVQ